MKNSILIQPTNVKVIYARNVRSHCVQLSSLQLKGSMIRLKYSVSNLIWNYTHRVQRFGFSVFTSLLAINKGG